MCTPYLAISHPTAPQKTILDLLKMREGAPKAQPGGRPLRVLVITFRRSLADKLEKDLEAAGAYVVDELRAEQERGGGRGVRSEGR